MAVIHKMTNFAPNVAVFGIRNRTATVVSNTPDPSRNTGWDINPWTACDIWVNRATDCGTPANLAKMAAYRRFTETIRRIAASPNFLPIKSCLLLAPNHQQARLLLTHPSLPPRIAFDVGAVVVKEVALNLDLTGLI